MDADFVIVGGGIGGAVLGERLARGGKRVLVLERNTEPPSFLRPELVWDASIDALTRLWPREEWLAEAALPVRGLRLFDGREEVEVITPSVLDEAGVHPWFENPNDTRELLLRRASFELRRGVEVIDVLAEHGRIHGVKTRELASGRERDVLAQCTVGDDGTHSRVRKACGIALELEEFPLDFLCFGLEWPASFEPAVGRVWLNSRSFASGIVGLFAMPFPRGRGAALVPVRAKVFDRFAHVDEAWREFLSSAAELREVAGNLRFPADMTRVTRQWGHAEDYGSDGALLVGDAIHPVSPVGGQGANMAIADACALSELILGDGHDVLASYERTRRPPNRRSIGFTRDASRLFQLPHWVLAQLVPVGIRRFARRRASVVQLLRTASTSFFAER